MIKHRQIERKGYVRRRVLPNISGPQQHHHMENGIVRDKQSEARFTAARARVRKRLGHYQNDPDMLGLAPVEGRKHTNIQTEKWLEEIKDRPIEADAAVQTEENLFQDGPRSDSPKSRLAPEFTPEPGQDKSTQILPDDPDLFVFDEEVGIVLEALVGKTLEMSLLEVIEEEEDWANRDNQRET